MLLFTILFFVVENKMIFPVKWEELVRKDLNLKPKLNFQIVNENIYYKLFSRIFISNFNHCFKQSNILKKLMSLRHRFS